jgi:hypothetical protein
MRAILVGIAVLAVVQQPQPSSQSCQSVMRAEKRIVVPFGYDGEVCYETFGQSLVCERAPERAERLKIR